MIIKLPFFHTDGNTMVPHHIEVTIIQSRQSDGKLGVCRILSNDVHHDRDLSHLPRFELALFHKELARGTSRRQNWHILFTRPQPLYLKLEARGKTRSLPRPGLELK